METFACQSVPPTSVETVVPRCFSRLSRWERVITHVPCGGTNHPGVDSEAVPAGRLLIVASQYSIDGVGGRLGTGGPEYVWADCPGVSFAGSMTFDADDMAVKDEFQLELLYLHEMAHVIGVGSVPSKADVSSYRNRIYFVGPSVSRYTLMNEVSQTLSFCHAGFYAIPELSWSWQGW